MHTAPYIIGVTGGIGSGKSVVSRLLRLMDVPVYDCDSEAKRLMCENASIRKALIRTVGDRVYDAMGRLDRACLASYMFGNAERVALINSIVHPVVRADFRAWAQHADRAVVAVESAILFEAGMEADVDAVWLVHAPEDMRLQRAIKRDASNEKAVRSRMQSQLDEQEYMRRADVVLQNDGNHSLISQVRELLSQR
ncbi:MAG: dephospho-CoA kinase [Bacteroidaceae bacterium]|nr:dephospho-CoA kinase [Bacteroidaceae bacterium]